jgi:hypothetical protein
MNEEYDKIITKLNDNIQELIFAYKSEKENNEKLSSELEKITNELNIYINKFKELEQKYNNLKLAKMISEEDGDEKDAKLKLTRIIREIDNCIALLNK